MSSASLQDMRLIYKNPLHFNRLATNNPKMKMQKTIPYRISSTYHLGIHVAKAVQNHKPLLKEMKEELNKQKDIPGSWIQRPNVVPMATHSKLIYLCNQFDPYQTEWNAER